MDEKSIMIKLEDVKNMHGKCKASQRYDILVVVTSEAWVKCGKVSVWIEDPIGKGITLLCSFGQNKCDKLYMDGFLQINNQYAIRGALINEYIRRSTYAPLQILLDQLSSIDKIKTSARIQISYEPSLIRDIARKADESKYLDIVAVPVRDMGGSFPRRIQLMDDSLGKITWTLWDEDAKHEKAIAAIMHKPVLIRNGLVKWFTGFGGEWQVRKPLSSIRRDLAIPRMHQVEEWYQRESHQCQKEQP